MITYDNLIVFTWSWLTDLEQFILVVQINSSVDSQFRMETPEEDRRTYGPKRCDYIN